MAKARIPVDVFNPGQVFACLGLMEATDILLGEATGYFSRENDSWEFVIACNGILHPVEAVAEFLISCRIDEIHPAGWKPWEKESDSQKREKLKSKIQNTVPSYEFPCSAEDLSTQDLPILVRGAFMEREIEQILYHWIDEANSETFKLYSGNRSACAIAKNMIWGDAKKGLPGIYGLYKENKGGFIKNPMNAIALMGGSFNFDARGTWNSIDAGYSPDIQKQKMLYSPFVEFMSIWGLQYARPKVKGRIGFYAIWHEPVPTNLARAFLGCAPIGEATCFRFSIASSGRNKIVNYAEEVGCHDT